MNSPDFIFVVSPTEYGGQIEHAYDTAVGLALHSSAKTVVLLTRPGAAAYLQNPSGAGVQIQEIFPRRRIKGHGARNILRPFLQFIDLLAEHVAVRRQMPRHNGAKVLMVLDTSRYPYPRALLPKNVRAKVALFVHNAHPHVHERRRSFRDKFLLQLERSSIKGVDLVVVHGDQQRATVSSYTRNQLASVPLPRTSFLDASIEAGAADIEAHPYALCIGELRENKGVEVAIAAAQEARVALIVAGKSHDENISKRLAQLAAQYEGISLRDEFLDKAQFDALIEGAKVVILPYTHFDAQSGILAKAMKAGRQIIVSELPALREQAGAYKPILFVPPGDVRKLAANLQEVMSSSNVVQADHNQNPEQEWKAVANVLLTHA